MSSAPLDPQQLRLRLKELVIEVCDLELEPDQIDDQEQLIRSEREDLDLTSLEAVEIAAAVDYEFEVRIEDLRGARQIMRCIDTLAVHIAAEKGWD